MSNHIKYELNNNLPLLKADFPGNIVVNGRFSKDLNKKQTHLSDGLLKETRRKKT